MVLANGTKQRAQNKILAYVGQLMLHKGAKNVQWGRQCLQQMLLRKLEKQ